jgi:hypothetical protein
VPVAGVVSDGQTSIRRAVEQALPGVPHQLCHAHYADFFIMPTFAPEPAPEAVIAATASA